MSGDIFLVRGDDELVPMVETAYDTEDVLQALIARFPDLLAGDSLPGDVPRRWLLIGREAALPAEEDGAGRWSVDHVFLDQDGVPTFVEKVKRSSDTRIRRGHRPDARLRRKRGRVLADRRAPARFSNAAARLFEGRDAETELGPVLGEEDEETYWAQAGANLKAGRIRLVFVADQIPRELRRVVEFLNGQMSAEVLAIEVKQYVGEGDVRTLVPCHRPDGRDCSRKKSGGMRRRSSPSWSAGAAAGRGGCCAQAARLGASEYEKRHLGQGPRRWLPDSRAQTDGQRHYPFAIYTYGGVEIQFQWLTRPPLDSPDVRLEFLARLNQIPGVQLPEDAITRRPRIQLSVLAADPAAIEGLINVLDWFRARASAGSSD